MTIHGKILACVDQSQYAEFVVEYAAWVAARTGAPLELLHVLDRHTETAKTADHSGAIGVNAQETLLEELAGGDEARSKAAREEGRVLLNRLRERAKAAGVVSPDMRQRAGVLNEALAEQEKDVRMFVLGRRGESADATQRDLGRNLIGVVRSLRKPILTVIEGFREPRRIMIAFDGSPASRNGVEMVAESPLFQGLPVHLIMAGKEGAHAARQLEWGKNTLETAGLEVTCALIPGDVESIIARSVQKLGIDMLVMGAYSHSYLRSFIFGSKTSDLLRSAAIPTLLMR